MVVTCHSKPVLGHPGTFSAPPPLRVDIGEHRRGVGITLVNSEGLVFAARWAGLVTTEISQKPSFRRQILIPIQVGVKDD